MVLDLTLRSSVSLTNLALARAAAPDAACSTSAESTKQAVLHLLHLHLLIATLRANDGLSGTDTAAVVVVPLGVVSADWSSTSGPNSWSEALWAESLFTLTLSASVVGAPWDSALNVLEGLESSVLVSASIDWAERRSEAAFDGVFNLHEGRFFPCSLSRLRGCSGSYNHRGRGHHHFEILNLKIIRKFMIS